MIKPIRPFRPNPLIIPRSLKQEAAHKAFIQAAEDQNISLCLEIGAGVGWHAIQFSQQNTGKSLLAIERTVNKFQKFKRRLAAHGDPTSVEAIHDDAVPWVHHYLKDNSLSEIYLLYPNPYPKNSASRWFRMPFMSCLLEKLKPKGTLQMATNVKPYYEEAKHYGQNIWGLTLIEDRLIQNPEAARTHFEKKYLLKGELCHDFIFQK